MPSSFRRVQIAPSTSAAQSLKVVRYAALHQAPRLARRPVVLVSAFKMDSDASHVSLPVTYYRLLRVPRASSREAVRKAYESLTKTTSSQANFSADTLFSRAVLLKAATECLSDLELRRSYEAKLQNGYTDLKVSQPDLPGALVLLQEIGEYETVINLGVQWLDAYGSNPDAGDVAACLALSYCDRAGEMLNDGAGPLLPVCQDLEKALVLTKQYGVAPNLQQDIEQALKDYAPNYAVELLGLPLGEKHAAQRTKGMKMLQQAIRKPRVNEDPEDGHWAADPKQQQQRLQDLMERARGVLTSKEQITLAGDIKACPFRINGASFDLALALIAEGFTQGWAHNVDQADRLLAQIEESAADGPDAPKQSVSVERAVCAVLLGDTDRALNLLGLLEGSTYPQDEEVHAFLKDHSQGGDDLLPGMCLMAKRWLQDVVSAGFRDTMDMRVDLDAWFENNQVATYLKVWQLAKGLPLFLQLVHLMLTLPGIITPALISISTLIASKAAAAQALVRALVNDAQSLAPQVAPEPSAAAPPSCLLLEDAAAEQQPQYSASYVMQERGILEPESPAMSSGTTAAAAETVDRKSGSMLGFTSAASPAVAQVAVVAAASAAAAAGAVVAAGMKHVSSSNPRPSSVRSGRLGQHEEDEMDQYDVGHLEPHPAYKMSASELRSQLSQMEKEMWDSAQAEEGRPMVVLVAKVVGVAVLVIAAGLALRDRLTGSSNQSSSPALATCTLSNSQAATYVPPAAPQATGSTPAPQGSWESQ